MFKGIKLFYYSILLSGVYLTVLYAQPDFQGKIEAEFSYRGEETDINYYTKDGKVRIEVEPENGGMKSTFIIKNETLFVLSPTEKRFTESPLKIQSKVKSYVDKSEKNSFIRTNERKRILDYEAYKWIYKGNDFEIELWNTGEPGNILAVKEIKDLVNNSGADWVQKLLSEGFFPLTAVQYDRNGEEIRKFEVEEIDTELLTDDLFIIPAEYKRISAGK